MTIAMGLGQFQRFLSCDLDIGLHTCDLGIGLHRNKENHELLNTASRQLNFFFSLL